MPRHRRVKRGGMCKSKRGRVRGGSLGSWLKKAGNFIKKHKLISRGASAYASRGGPYSGLVGSVGKAASMFGLGLSPGGGALRLAGGMRRPGRVRRKTGRRRVYY